MKISLKRARPTVKTVVEKSVKAEKGAAQKMNPKTNQKSNLKIQTRLAAPAQLGTPVALAAQELSAKKSVAAKRVTKSAVSKSSAPKAASPAKAKTRKSSVEKPAALRATKKRAPRDLANQYGESSKTARTTVAEAAPRKRRNAATRAKLQAVITPDDGLLLRLARAGAISSAHIPENENGAPDQSFRAPIKRHSRKWETRCGKCGLKAQYSSAAALCVKCGAILVRD